MTLSADGSEFNYGPRVTGQVQTSDFSQRDNLGEC